MSNGPNFSEKLQQQKLPFYFEPWLNIQSYIFDHVSISNRTMIGARFNNFRENCKNKKLPFYFDQLLNIQSYFFGHVFN
jgi:hypothetical protein